MNEVLETNGSVLQILSLDFWIKISSVYQIVR